MKNEILCTKCGANFRQMFQTDSPYPGEYVKKVDGKALRPFVCDRCSAEIINGQDCCATTIWSDSIPYQPWETDFIEEARHAHPE